MHKSGAKFDPEKAKWFNQQYLRKKSDAELAETFKPLLAEKGFQKDNIFLETFCKLLKEKVHFVHEFWEQGSYIFIRPTSYDDKVIGKKWNAESLPLFKKVLDTFNQVEDWTSENTHSAFENLVKDAGKIDMQLLRVLITGVAGGPQLFDMLALLGKEESINRLETALQKLN